MPANRRNGARLQMYNRNSGRMTSGISIASISRAASRRANANEGVRTSRGDMNTATTDLRNAQERRNRDVANQKNARRNGNGQFLSNSQIKRNARNARQKQAYDIKQAFGVSVG